MSRFDASLVERALAAVRGRPAPAVERVPSSDPVDEALLLAGALCRQFEGFHSKPYLCPAGVWTIGYGATYYPDGRRVGPRDLPIDREQAERLMFFHLRKEFLPQVLTLCPVLMTSTPRRLAAILDFTFNLGARHLKNSTLRRRINSERWQEVPDELMKWNKAGGVILRGLTRRRQAEADLIPPFSLGG